MTRTREAVELARPVQVETVPGAASIELPAGTTALLVQALGSSFTLAVHGQLVRLAGSDADAIGREQPAAVAVDPELRRDDVAGLVWQVLKTCYDPEIPVDIVELGLVYACDVVPVDDESVRVSIRMTVTAPGCGMGEAIAHEVREKVAALPRVAAVDVALVFDPPWDRTRLSESALLALGL